MSNQEKWDGRFLKVALEIAGWSKDPSTQVGCVIVGEGREILSTGYNGLPRGLDDADPARNERPEKYYWYEHGERNAIYNAVRNGVGLRGSTLYVTSTPSKFTVCTDCARAIIQAGVTRVVQEPLDKTSEAALRWKESAERVQIMFKEAGIQFDEVDIT